MSTQNRRHSMASTSSATPTSPRASRKLSSPSPSPSTAICTHPSHASVVSGASGTGTSAASAGQACESEQEPLATDHYRRQLAAYKENVSCRGGETAKINGQLNEIFLRRLTDIDCNGNGDMHLKLVTYQEWVDMLLRINESIISNMEGLESEVSERLELLSRKSAAPCRHSQGTELAKCRKDICTLVRLVQNGYHKDNWSMQGMKFETITPSQVLGISIDNRTSDGNMVVASYQDRVVTADAAAAAQRNKLVLSMKALAIEVAEKHDEVREMKKQIGCLEDEIQKAQQKIQLKDDVIRELRNDLKKFACQQDPLDYQHQMTPTPINLESPHTNSRSATTQVSGFTTPLLRDDYGSQFESYSQHEQVEQAKLRALEEELNELFEVTKDWKKQNLEYHRKRLSDIFHTSEMEKADAYRKLDFIRQQLIDLEATSAEHWATNTDVAVATASTSGATTTCGPSTDCDSGFSCKSGYNQDAKILEALRRRLRKLNEATFELTKRVQKLEIENSEVLSHLETEKSFGNRNSDILKEIADLLSNLTGEQFSYKDIYSKHPNCLNPFCTSIAALQRSFTQREKELTCQLKRREKKIEEMQETFYNDNRLQQNMYADTNTSDDYTCNTAKTNNTTTTSTTTTTTATTISSEPDVPTPTPTQFLAIPQAKTTTSSTTATTSETLNPNSYNENDFSVEFWNW